MAKQTRRRVRVVVILVMLIASCSVIFGPLAPSRAQPAAGSDTPAMRLVSLKMKFNGARSCGGKNCHDKSGEDAPPTEPGHEYTIWNAADKHRKSAEVLGEQASTDIGKKLNIADVKTSERCLNCHALAVPEALRGAKFNLKEGNTCEQCHGPSEKWLEAHSEKGWTDKQRTAAGSHDALLSKWGLYDTKPLTARAQICVGCHLPIESDLVAAGHPQPEFELDYFTLAEPKHWREEEGYHEAKVWLAGQSAAIWALSNLSPKNDANAQQLLKAHTAVDNAALTALGITDKTNVDPVNPDKKGTLAALNSIAGLSLTKDAGKFGMNQQAYAISALYNAYAKAEKVPDAQRDEMNKLIESKLFPPEKGELTVEQFEKNLPEVRAKLPK
jgi:hypothetical protein